jgi:ATP-dependent DNA helicase DinG
MRNMLSLPQYFGRGGALQQVLEGFTPRPGQLRMAERIATALERRQLLLVEAGTGTGKTFAYLVPALLSGRRVLISTGTRTLQDQLYNRDLPLLAGALGRPVQVALLKGRANYLCRARLAAASAQPELLAGAAAGLLERLAAWARATRTGDLAEIAELGDAHPLRGAATSTRDNCSGTRCAEYARCCLFAARRAALDADIVIVNHHLLLADLALKEEGFGELLPSVDACILDEAHQLPDLAAEAFGEHVSARQVELLLQDTRRALLVAGLSSSSAQLVCTPLEQALRALQAPLGRGERRQDWLDLDAAARDGCAALAAALGACGDALDATALEHAEIRQCAERARALCRVLRHIVTAEPGEGARALSVGARGFALSLLPYDVAVRFGALTEQYPSAWIFTSATLALDGHFEHFARRLGLESAETLLVDSPFDFERQALLYLPPDLPDPASASYTGRLLEAVLPLVQAAGGGAFLLFTSHRALAEAATRLRGALPAQWPLLVQGEGPREQLLARFRESGRAVLLGTASFWEGVDVQGSALRLVVIDKLPFAPPDDPIVRARVQHLKATGGQPFRDYQLPEAAMALKQGVGRLIRSEADRGVVVICDPRLVSRGYGRSMLACLPPMPITRDPQEAIGRLRRQAAELPA